MFFVRINAAENGEEARGRRRGSGRGGRRRGGRGKGGGCGAPKVKLIKSLHCQQTTIFRQYLTVGLNLNILFKYGGPSIDCTFMSIGYMIADAAVVIGPRIKVLF